MTFNDRAFARGFGATSLADAAVIDDDDGDGDGGGDERIMMMRGW